jgi:hypothetical protein
MPKDDTFLVVAAWAFGSFKNAKSCENKWKSYAHFTYMEL